MNYRKQDKFNLECSLLGFGAMRLPTNSENPKDIDRKAATEMIRFAIDNGVNYVDTAWVYHQEESEVLVGEALKDGYREKVSLATKNPTWLVKKEEDWDKFLDMQLEKLQTDHIDFYLQHSLDRGRWENVKKMKMWEHAVKAKEEGKIKYYGFSFHDDLSLFKEIINAHDWDFCQIQLNYLDENYQAGLEGLKIAREKNIPVVIMEPLRGGMLANRLPKLARELMENSKYSYSPVEWAFKYLANQEGILTILSGMSTMEQVKDNVRIFKSDSTKENNMLDDEAEFMKELVNVWKKSVYIPCTNCKYCMPCPNGVDIPECFRIYNAFKEERFGYKEDTKEDYSKLIKEGADASNCIECGACMAVCPQQINITEKLKEINEMFGEAK